MTDDNQMTIPASEIQPKQRDTRDVQRQKTEDGWDAVTFKQFTPLIRKYVGPTFVAVRHDEIRISAHPHGSHAIVLAADEAKLLRDYIDRCGII